MAGRPPLPRPPTHDRDLLDRWLLAELQQLIMTVSDAYETYDATNATRPIEDFVERLSNWYVRLSRERFWKSEVDDSKLSAYATLYETLTALAKLLAPAHAIPERGDLSQSGGGARCRQSRQRAPVQLAKA